MYVCVVVVDVVVNDIVRLLSLNINYLIIFGNDYCKFVIFFFEEWSVVKLNVESSNAQRFSFNFGDEKYQSFESHLIFNIKTESVF